jgi:histidine triad (HIT) family protein
MPLQLPHNEICPFCEMLEGRREGPFVTRGPSVSAVVNLKQFERGALLVIPNRHTPTLLAARAGEIAEVAAEAQRLARALVRAFEPVGLSVYQNNGIQAGQTVAHYHVHLVPRYADSNPRKVFSEYDYEPAPLAEREVVARAVRAALEELEQAGA